MGGGGRKAGAEWPRLSALSGSLRLATSPVPGRGCGGGIFAVPGCGWWSARESSRLEKLEAMLAGR
jgi:hypothetical protein